MAKYTLYRDLPKLYVFEEFNGVRQGGSTYVAEGLGEIRIFAVSDQSLIDIEWNQVYDLYRKDGSLSFTPLTPLSHYFDRYGYERDNNHANRQLVKEKVHSLLEYGILNRY